MSMWRGGVRVRSYLAAALVACGAAALAPAGCSGTKGQLMFVFQTDMSLPKDIDAVRILVTLEGAVVFDETYTRLGSEESIRLPATLGFLTPDDPAQTLHLRVIASQGGEDNVRLMSQVVTTVPEDRTAVIEVPLQLLCYGLDEVKRDAAGNIERDARGAPKSRCGDTKTCRAGSCTESEVRSIDLPDYVAAKVFGGGTGKGDGLCFDTWRCFESEQLEHIEAALDLTSYQSELDACLQQFPPCAPGDASCSSTAAEECQPPCWVELDPRVDGSMTSEINLALLTQGGGICSTSECYAPLDAESDVGFRAEEVGGRPRLRLPSAVCQKAQSGQVRGVAAVRAGEETCQRKTSSLPTCGPWSASGEGTPVNQEAPLPIALGLTQPVALEVTAKGVYWTERGTFTEDGQPAGDGAVKWVPRDGGQPLIVAANLRAPRDLVVRERLVQEITGTEAAPELVFWTMPGEGISDGAIGVAAPESWTTEGVVLLPGLGRPEGLALRTTVVGTGEAARIEETLFWTEELDDKVVQAATTATGLDLTVGQQNVLASSTSGQGLEFRSPYRIATAADVVCWVYQGQLDPPSPGAVACARQDGGPVLRVAASQTLPRALALQSDGAGNLQLYWASYDANGMIFRAELTSEGGDLRVQREPEPVLATAQPYPGGLAVGETHIYWTSQAAGAVLRAPKPTGPGQLVEPEPLASSQTRPGDIVVYRDPEASADTVYWINEGSSEQQGRDGAILRLDIKEE